MASNHSERQRPKSSQPISFRGRRPLSVKKVKSPPCSGIIVGGDSQDDLSDRNKHVLEILTEIPTVVRVCTGNYRTCSGQYINRETCKKLYIHKKVQREVVRIKYLFPKNTRIVNLPISTSVQVGFEHPTSNFKNVKQVVKEGKHLPKLLFVVQGCQCSPSHDISESNVLIVTGLTRKKELIVLNKYSLKTWNVPQNCMASFTTDPKQACIELADLKFLDQSSLPWEKVILKGSLNVFGSPQKNKNMTIVDILTEDCAIVQICGQIEKHLIPLKANLEVQVIQISGSREREFPENTYESMDSDLVNQPTVMDYPRRGSITDIIRPQSARSGVSSIASSSSSFFSEAESSAPRLPRILEGSPDLVLSLSTILHETREVTRVFILGLELGIPEYILEGMESDFPHNLERRKAALFSHWLRTDDNASWRNIVTALQNMGEISVSKRIVGKNYHSADYTEETDALHEYENYDEDLNEEQKRKENLEKFDEELKQMRKKLQHIENLSMFQRREGSTNHQKLLEMKMRIDFIETHINFTHHLHILARDNHAQKAHVARQTGRNAKQPASDTYYNAVPLKELQYYVPKLWVSEKDIVSLELEETVARRKVLEKGKSTSEKQLSKLTASTLSTDGPQSDDNVLEECYYVRLLLNKIIYKLKLCELEIFEDHLKQKIKEIDEEMEAEMISLPKHEALSNLLPHRLQQHPTPQTYTTYKYRDDTLQYPVPKPRKPKIRPQSSKTITMVNYLGKHKTLPDSRSLSCPPNNSSPVFEPLHRPTPKPRTLRTVPSLSRENSFELPNTPLQSRRSQEQLPQIPQTSSSSGQHLRPRTSIPYPPPGQKPAVPPRRFQPKPTS